ncbi:MAG: helix-turn-helix domain-containing protein [Acidimicrobiales bacterium]
MGAPASGPGRPRDRTIDDAVLAAARELLAAVGYEALSMSAVAEAAGTTRQALYRRWSSKADLATAAVAAMSEADARPETDDPSPTSSGSSTPSGRRLPPQRDQPGGRHAAGRGRPELRAKFRESGWCTLAAPGCGRHPRTRVAAGLLDADADLERSWPWPPAPASSTPRPWPAPAHRRRGRRGWPATWRACGSVPPTTPS